MRIWIIAVALLAAIAQSAGLRDFTFERLAKVDRFAFGGIGYAGVISQGEKDYKVILSRPSATADFERLLLIGNSQAKGYALVGIRALDPSRFKELSHSLRDSKEGLLTEKGCIVSHESLVVVLNRIEAGEYSKGKWPGSARLRSRSIAKVAVVSFAANAGNISHPSFHPA